MKNNVKYLRRSEDFDLSQNELAEAIGVSRATIISLENGKRTSDEVLMKIAHFFNKDPREIFFVEGVASNLQKPNSA